MDIYLVGGAVRDKLLNQAPRENDYVVVGATPQEMLDKGFKQVGKDFPVFLHPQTHEEYALARKERKQGIGYHGFEMDANASISLEEDLLRRDLTINAIAESKDGEIIDPYNGVGDIQQKVLRHVSKAFIEDPLRVLRVARFQAMLPDFTIAPDTLKMMQKLCGKSSELKSLSHERIWLEITKASAYPAFSLFWEVLDSCGALKALNLSLDIPALVDGMESASSNHLDRLISGLWYQEKSSILSLLNLSPPGDVLAFSKIISDYGSAILNAEQNDPLKVLELCQRLDPYRRLDRAQRLIHTIPYKHQNAIIFWNQLFLALTAIDIQSVISNSKPQDRAQLIENARLETITHLCGKR